MEQIIDAYMISAVSSILDDEILVEFESAIDIVVASSYSLEILIERINRFYEKNKNYLYNWSGL